MHMFLSLMRMVDIISSLFQSYYIAESLKTHTELVQRQEVYAETIREHRVYHGSGAHVRFFHMVDGDAYGFTIDGGIYIAPRIARSYTAVHEYAHLWASALRAENKEEWKNIANLMKGTSVWEEIKETYPELKTDDEIANEVLATYFGRRGAERLRKEINNAMADGTASEKEAAVSALERVKQAIERFGHAVANFLHIHYTSAKQVADQVMKDLLDGVDPREFGKEDKGKVRYPFISEIGAEDALSPNKRVSIVKALGEHGLKNYAKEKACAKEYIAGIYNSEETGDKGYIRISNTTIDKDFNAFLDKVFACAEKNCLYTEKPLIINEKVNNQRFIHSVAPTGIEPVYHA